MVLDSSKEFFKEFVRLLFETILKVHLYAKERFQTFLIFGIRTIVVSRLSDSKNSSSFILFSRA
jgi:hypothetical protein